jgi:isoleucyl-tRNA synthetase
MNESYSALKIEDFIDKFSAEDWANIQLVRNAVYKELEALRAAKTIGSGLEAEVALYCDEKMQKLLTRFWNDKTSESELRFLFIVSAVTLHPLSEKPADAILHEDCCKDVWLKIVKSSHSKCSRCWQHREDTGKDDGYSEICSRCVTNLQEGEERLFA